MIGADGVKTPAKAVGYFGFEVQPGVIDADQRNARLELDNFARWGRTALAAATLSSTLDRSRERASISTMKSR